MDQNPTTTAATTEEQKPQTQIIDKGAYVIEESIFGGALEGLKYFVLQFKSGTDEEANASVSAIQAKYNAKQIVAVMNSAIRSAQRVKAQQEIISLEKDKQPQEIVKRLQHNPILFSAEQAEAWVPGERELTIQGMMRKIAELTKEGDNLGAMKLLLEVQKQMQEKLQEDSQQS